MKMAKPKINDSFSKPKNWPTLIVTNVGWVFGFFKYQLGLGFWKIKSQRTMKVQVVKKY
jgi:hypothetical protein